MPVNGSYGRFRNPCYVVRSQMVGGSSQMGKIELPVIFKTVTPPFSLYFSKPTPQSRMYEWCYPEILTPHRLLKEIFEFPTGLRMEKVLTSVVEAPKIVKVNPDGSFELNFRGLEREDVYYSFFLHEDYFLAKKEGNTVRVCEAYKVEDRLLALPTYEVSLT